MNETYMICAISGVPSGGRVYTGYASEVCTAPAEPGTYTLYEKVWTKTHTHAGWLWVPGDPVGKKAWADYEEMKCLE